uniref:MHC class I-like antigen recognition-like domain-containing protein n=1 Tax=Naja naja TaxID=35670 RepID=A0A8C6VBQ9_NAJNA
TAIMFPLFLKVCLWTPFSQIYCLPPFFPPGSSSHSLRTFYTLVLGSNQDVLQYIVVAYVDDQLVSRFDLTTRRMLPQVPWLLNVKKEDLHIWDFISQRVSNTERNYLTFSAGTHSWQRMIGCQLSKDGHKQGLDQKTLTWTAVDIRAQVIKRRWEAQPFIAQNRNIFLEKECIELLQKCMVYGKDYLLRKGKGGQGLVMLQENVEFVVQGQITDNQSWKGPCRSSSPTLCPRETLHHF